VTVGLKLVISLKVQSPCYSGAGRWHLAVLKIYLLRDYVKRSLSH
jgi:hypothetical protein